MVKSMRGIENKKLNDRIVELWRTGRYKSFSSLARTLHIKHPKIVERAIKRATKPVDLSKALRIAEENQNSQDLLNGD